MKNKKKIQSKTRIVYKKILYEMVVDEDKGVTQFVSLNGEGIPEYRASFILNDAKVQPFPIDNDLIQNKVILFPSIPMEFGTENDLIVEIKCFIHKYLQISPFFEKLTPFYVLFTWLYDHFKELPYLRAIADYGRGKSRFLKVIGSICYKPMFTVGATTSAPIFRMLEQYGGTLILDEADLRFSDTNAEMVKILNNGFQDGLPVLRCADSSQDYEIKTFKVFGPKIVATRNKFDDKALESRFLIEYMDAKLTRNDIPLNLDDEFYEKALEIRNKCLMWRLRNFGNTRKSIISLDRSIQPRLNQIISPLASIIEDETLKQELVEFVKEYDKELIAEKGFSFEAPILETIIRLVSETDGGITMKAISERFNNDCLIEWEKGLNPRKIGSIIKDKFRFKTEKTREGYILSRNSYNLHIDRLCENYGIDRELVNVANVDKSDDIKAILGEIGYKT